MGFVEAEREKVNAQIAIMGPSGSGKTVGALKIAYGMTGDWSKIGVVDTEHDRSKVYVGTNHTGGSPIGKFMHMKIEPDYTPAKFSEALREAVKAGLEVIIFDSFSHEWDGVGGITDWANELGGKYQHWLKPKKTHKELIDEIMHAPINVIATIRTKQEYAIVPGGGKDGKSSVEKLGMKPVQSGDIDYEFLVAFTVDTTNIAETTKDNTGLFKGLNEMLTEDHGRMLREWVGEGKEVKTVIEVQKELRSRKQELVDQFTEQRKATPKAEKFFTSQEIKTGIDIKDWDLKMLESLDQQLRLAAEKKKAPKPEEPKQEESQSEPETKQEEQKPATGRDAMIEEIKELYKIKEVQKVCKEYLAKMKVKKFDGLKDEHVTLLLSLAQRKAQTAQQEQKGA